MYLGMQSTRGDTDSLSKVISRLKEIDSNVLFSSSDATHTLVCAILLLNSDLHGEVSWATRHGLVFILKL